MKVDEVNRMKEKKLFYQCNFLYLLERKSLSSNSIMLSLKIPSWNAWNRRHILVLVLSVRPPHTRSLYERIDPQFDQHQGLGCGLMGSDCMNHHLPDVTHPHNETRRQRMIANGEPLLLRGPHLRCKHTVPKSRHKWLCPFYSVMMVFFTEACSSAPPPSSSSNMKYDTTSGNLNTVSLRTLNGMEVNISTPFATLHCTEGSLFEHKVRKLDWIYVRCNISLRTYVSLLWNDAINFFRVTEVFVIKRIEYSIRKILYISSNLPFK